MADLFDGLAEAEFERLPGGMAYCPARCSLDDGISKILGLDLGKLRDLLASEPVVSNRRL